MSEWHKTACILCSINCGLEVQTKDGHITRVRGDRAHPASQGYLCEKPQGLDKYQNGRHRLDTPLRRTADGTFEPIDWDTAITEVAAKLKHIRDTHGGDKIFYYGGGGQGNHLGGAHATATRAVLGNVHRSNALAQEKTGEFWVDGNLFGKANCHTTGDFEHAEVAIFLGKNPWHSHGFPRARAVIREIAKDPNRCLIVIDPRRTETAEKADIHLGVRPGTDSFLLTALLAVLVGEDLVDHAFIEAHTNNAETLFTVLGAIPIAEYADKCGLDEETVRTVARRIGNAKSVSIFEDLGIQMAPHSTLNSYLNKLLYILTGNFAKQGGMNLHTALASLFSSALETGKTPATGARMLTGLVPCNSIAPEILSGHPDAWRAMIVDSANPAHSLADSNLFREALEALDFVVVTDVALTETAKQADYVLPASSQFEKWEATNFNLEFPENYYHLRAPVFDPLPGTLTEAEIHSRLAREIGALDGVDLTELEEAARQGLDAFGWAFMGFMASHPDLQRMATLILYETLGPALPNGAKEAAPLWGAAQMCAQRYPESVKRAGFEGDGPALGNALFEGILNSPSGIVFSMDEYEETWSRIRHDDGKINLVVDELLPELASLEEEDPRQRPAGFPFVLAAGERRSGTANTIYRAPDWQKKGRDGALRVNPDDAERLGLADGGRARVTTKRGIFETDVEFSDTLQAGHITMPNGHGLTYPDEQGVEHKYGVSPNDFTAVEDRDPIAGTPWHKHVPANLEAV